MIECMKKTIQKICRYHRIHNHRMRLRLKQAQQTKLSPRQVQFAAMLQVPADALRERVQEELASNPTLEEEKSEDEAIPSSAEAPTAESYSSSSPSSKKYTARPLSEDILKGDTTPLQPSSHEKLLDQLAFLSLTPREKTIARFLLGSLSPEGYLSTNLTVVAHNIDITHYLDVDKKEVEAVLHKIHTLDPPGIGARDLRESLLIQLTRKKPTQAAQLATAILRDAFDAFSKKNYRKIIATLNIEDEALLKEALSVIKQLSPQPITAPTQPYTRPCRKKPDFVVTKDPNGTLQIGLYRDYAPKLRIRKQYRDMLQSYERKKDPQAEEVKTFVRQNIERAQWFIESIERRKTTLLKTMKAIVKLQESFFRSPDEQNLKPLFMRHVAAEIGMDLSTISRVVSRRNVATNFAIYPLKYFFSEAITTTEGAQVSSTTIKALLKKRIQEENKQQPYTDEELVSYIQEKGYLLARRTVAKYRTQLGIPVARMRREL